MRSQKNIIQAIGNYRSITSIDDEVGTASPIDPDAVGLHTPASALLATSAGELIGHANIVTALKIDRAQPIIIAAAFTANALRLTSTATPAAPASRRELAAATSVYPDAVAIEAPRLAANASCLGRLLHEYRVAPRHLAARETIVVAGTVRRTASLCVYRRRYGRQCKTRDYTNCRIQQNLA